MWFRSLVFAVALVSVSLPALARGELSDARKWKVLLPTVRASTDCIARGIATSPTALNYARQENWLEAAKSTSDECRSFGSHLVAEHDRLYGRGTGKKFVEGPYAADLPRALKARIGLQIARLAAQPVKTEEAPGLAVAATNMPLQIAAPPLPLQSDALDQKGDLVPPLEARIAPDIERETAQPAKADGPTLPTVGAVAETSVQVLDPRSLLQSDAPEPADSTLSALPNETATHEHAVVEKRSVPPVDTPTAESKLSAASLTSTADERSSGSDRPARWSLAYMFVLLGLVVAALYGARRTRGWKTDRPQERPVLLQARRDPVPASGLGGIPSPAWCITGTARVSPHRSLTCSPTRLPHPALHNMHGSRL